MRWPTKGEAILAGFFLVEGAAAFYAGVQASKEKYRREYAASTKAMQSAMELARRIDRENLVVNPIEADLEEALEESTIPTPKDVFGSGLQTYEPDGVTAYKPDLNNPYHKAVNAIDTPVATFMSGEPNVYGISFIEEEEFLEDDGREKHTVTLVMDAHNPVFYMNGELLEDWDERMGVSIVKDFLTHVAPGPDPVLFVRNNKTEDDYEIQPEHP